MMYLSPRIRWRCEDTMVHGVLVGVIPERIIFGSKKRVFLRPELNSWKYQTLCQDQELEPKNAVLFTDEPMSCLLCIANAALWPLLPEEEWVIDVNRGGVAPTE